jgi:hypothetical protein
MNSLPDLLSSLLSTFPDVLIHLLSLVRNRRLIRLHALPSVIIHVLALLLNGLVRIPRSLVRVSGSLAGLSGRGAGGSVGSLSGGVGLVDNGLGGVGGGLSGFGDRSGDLVGEEGGEDVELDFDLVDLGGGDGRRGKELGETVREGAGVIKGGRRGRKAIQPIGRKERKTEAREEGRRKEERWTNRACSLVTQALPSSFFSTSLLTTLR